MTGKADAVLTAKIAHRFLKEPQSDLNSYSGLSVAAAVCLSKHKGELTLDGLSSLSDAVAESLGHHEGSLSLGGLTGLSNAAAASLSKHKGDLTLDCVTSISAAALMSLSVHEGFVSMTSLANITAEHAKALVSFRSGIDVPLEDVDPDIRCILARHPSLRIDSSRVESWLLDELGYDYEVDWGRDWIDDKVFGDLLSACDGSEGNDPNGDGTLGSRLDDVMRLFKKAGNCEIHVVYLYDKGEHTLVFIGSFEEVKKKLLPLVSLLHKKNPADDDTSDDDDDDFEEDK